MVFRIESFVNNDGSKIEMLTPLNEDSSNEDGSNEDFIKFVGVAHMVSDYASTEVRFPISDADSIDEAFIEFEDSLNKFMDSVKDQMDKPEIIIPDNISISSPNILSD